MKHTQSLAEIISRHPAAAKGFNATKTAKMGAGNYATPTPVYDRPFSIEEIVIEKKVIEKEVSSTSKEMDKLLELFDTKPKSRDLNPAFKNRSIQQLRYVDNRQHIRNGELILPEEIIKLVDNPMYLPRHRKLARDYGVNYLLKLAELARTKGKPSHWYAKATSKDNWKQTEEMLIGLFKKIDKIKDKLQGIGVSSKWINYFVGAADKLPEARFNNCIELAKSRGAKKPPNLLARAIKINLEQYNQLQATKQAS